MYSSGMRTVRLLAVSQHALGRRVYPSMHLAGMCARGDIPPVERMTDTCKNITFP